MKRLTAAAPHLRRVAILAGGATGAQVLALLASPILTRIYTPFDFGILALFVTLVSVLGAVACGRYHMAIALPTNEVEALHITSLALLILALFSGLITVALLIAILASARLGPFSELGWWLMAVPAGVFLTGLFEIATYYNLRIDRSPVIALSQWLRAGLSVSSQICLGLLGLRPGGLLIGNLAAGIGGNIRLFNPYLSNIRKSPIDRARLRKLAVKYSRFPQFDTPSALMSAAATSIMPIGIAFIYSAPLLGQYALAYRLAALPSVLIGTAVSQAYLREAAIRKGDPERAKRLFDKTAILLITMSLPFFIAAAFGAQWLFETAFGKLWKIAGLMSVVMLPQIWMRFISSPLSTTFIIVGRQRELMFFQALILTVTLMTLVGAHASSWTVITLLIVQSGAMTPIYAALLVRARSLASGV